MQRTDFQWDDWRFFLAVAREGSLSKAGRLLQVNPSTVHRRIAQLEGVHGARLFDRLARGYALTPLGAAVLARVEGLEADLLDLSRTVSGADQQLAGVIRFTTVLELFEVLAPGLARFRREHPGISLEITTMARVLLLGRHEADVALRPGRPPTEPDVVGRRLAASPIAVYGSVAYLEERGTPLRNKLEGHDAVLGPRPSPELQTARAAVCVDSKRAQVAACRAGLGLADLPCFVGDGEADLVKVFDLDVPDLELWVLTHVDLRRTARVKVFVDALPQMLASVGATGKAPTSPRGQQR